MSHKLLYIPSGNFCSFHQEGSGIRTLVIEESAIYKEWNNVTKSVEVLLKAMKAEPYRYFTKVNNISNPVLLEEFEVTND